MGFWDFAVVGFRVLAGLGFMVLMDSGLGLEAFWVFWGLGLGVTGVGVGFRVVGLGALGLRVLECRVLGFWV